VLPVALSLLTLGVVSAVLVPFVLPASLGRQ
jgi:hypothetical protein